MSYTGIKDKVAIITGAGEGIGYAIAELLVLNGSKVVINDIDETACAEACNKLNLVEPESCRAFCGDAGNINVINELVDFTLNSFGQINIVIPNAGITLFGSFLEFTPESFQKVINLNLQGAFFLVQRVAKEFIRQGNGGKVVLMSSQVGIRAYKNLTAYGMTKAALQMMATSLTYELGPHRINFNVVAPGATLTSRTEKEQPDYSGTWGNLNPNSRVGTPKDIANTCLFLVSDEASHINGQTIPVDGGWTTAGKYPEDL